MAGLVLSVCHSPLFALLLSFVCVFVGIFTGTARDVAMPRVVLLHNVVVYDMLCIAA